VAADGYVGQAIAETDILPPEGALTEEDTANQEQAAQQETIRELESAIHDEMDDAFNFSTSKLAEERGRALDYYHGRPFGNEREGRSDFVLTHVRDAIEWAMPSLLAAFTSSDDVVRYEPRGPEDVEGAEQATDFANYIFYGENAGFQILYSWIKDGLREKTGYVKRYYEEPKEFDDETYEGLTEAQLVELMDGMQEGQVEPIAHESYEVNIEGMPVMLHNVTVRVWREGRIVIENVAPEDVQVARDTGADLQKCGFLRHRMEKTVQEMHELGFDPEEVKTWASFDTEHWTEEELSRETVEDQVSWGDTEEHQGPNRVIRFSEIYYRWDLDGDGYAELLKVWMIGEGRGKVVDVEPVDEIPFSYWTPIPEPHKHYGQSFAEQVFDLQRVDSDILRQFLDNLRQANNIRPIVREGSVYMDDVLTSVPYGPIRVKKDAMGALQDQVQFPQQPIVAPQALSALEYMAQVREERLGISRYTQGMHADSLNQTATGISRLQEASFKRLGLIAKVFAETGLKDLFKAILRLAKRHQNVRKIIRLRGDFIEVDPSSWNDEMDVEVSVGLGTGNRDQNAAHLNMILQDQSAVVAAGGLGWLVDGENLYHTRKRLLENMGFKDVDAFYQNPSDQPPPDEGPSDVEQKLQAEMMMKQAELASKQAIELEKIASEERIKAAEIEADLEMARLQAESRRRSAA
jgi:hypothetical protein